MALQTGQPDPVHDWRQVQWKTCWHGIVMSPEVSSMRSRHTVQVGSSTRSGVGGGNGLSELRWPTVDPLDELAFGSDGVSIVIDLMKVT